MGNTKPSYSNIISKVFSKRNQNSKLRTSHCIAKPFVVLLPSFRHTAGHFILLLASYLHATDETFDNSTRRLHDCLQFVECNQNEIIVDKTWEIR